MKSVVLLLVHLIVSLVKLAGQGGARGLWSVRHVALKHEIRAYEGAAGVQLSQFWLGYRALKFDVGPVLQGPEAG